MIRQNILIFLCAFVFSCAGKKEEYSNEKYSNNKAEVGDITLIPEMDNALNFINNYVANCNKMDRAKGIIEWVNGSRLATNDFKIELGKIIKDAKENEPELGLGFDPIFNAQDYPEKGFEFEKYDNNKNILIVKGRNWESFRLSMKIKKESNQWLVDGCGIVNLPLDEQIKR